MSTVQPTDKTLVNRAGVDHSAPADMSTVQDTDLLLINRAGVDYKCTFADWKASQASINTPSITSPSNGAGQTTTPQTSEIISSSGITLPPATTYLTKNPPTSGAFNPSDHSINWNTGDPADNITVPIPLGTRNQAGRGMYMLIKLDVASGLTVSRVPDAAGGAKMWGCNTPDCSDGWTLAGTSATRSVTSNTAYQYYVYQLDSLSTMDFTVYYPTAGIAVGVVTLGFATDKDLALLSVGDTVTLNTGSVTSSVGSIDVSGKTITVSGKASDFPANSGNYLIGTPSLSADAALGETPTFTSSAFAGTGTTHASSDWQVTLATDTTFASPVVQSMADATNKVSWDGGPLQANTDYIVRVRHNGTGGISSAWSAVVAFKTKSAFIAKAVPSSIMVLTTGAAVDRLFTSPGGIKFVNAAVSYNGNHPIFFAVGTDGALYGAAEADTAFAKTSVTNTAAPGIPLAAIATNYGRGGLMALFTNGVVGKGTYTGPGAVTIATHGNGTDVVEIGNYSSISDVYYAKKSDGTLWACLSGDSSFSQLQVPLPGTEKLKHFAAIRGSTGLTTATGWMALSDAGNLYHFDGTLTAGARALKDSGVKTLSSAGGGGGPSGAVYLKDDGSSYQVSETGVATAYNTGIVDIMQPYQYGPIELKADGSVFVAKTKVNDSHIHGLKNFGLLPWCSASTATTAIIFTGN
jgi:hypothetical protein